MQTSFPSLTISPTNSTNLLCSTDYLGTSPAPSIHEISQTNIENSMFGEDYLKPIIQSRTKILSVTPLVPYNETTIGSRSRRSPPPKLVYYDETNITDTVSETTTKSCKTPEQKSSLVPYDHTAIDTRSKIEASQTQHLLVPYTDTVVDESMEASQSHTLKIVPYDDTVYYNESNKSNSSISIGKSSHSRRGNTKNGELILFYVCSVL